MYVNQIINCNVVFLENIFVQKYHINSFFEPGVQRGKNIHTDCFLTVPPNFQNQNGKREMLFFLQKPFKIKNPSVGCLSFFIWFWVLKIGRKS